MQRSITHVIEIIIGAILIGLGLLYLSSQYRVLSNLMDIVTISITEDNKIHQQYDNTNILQVTDKDVYTAIMGYREYPIMVDDNVVLLKVQDYELYFSYIKEGNYRKDYRYDANRNIVMILFSYQGL